jgi:hypothetical protein
MTTGFPLWNTSSSDPATVPHPKGERPLDIILGDLEFLWNARP